MNLASFDPKGFSCYRSPTDTLDWLHIYMSYLCEREVKRTYQYNQIPEADIKRLLKQNGIEDTSESREKLVQIDRVAYDIGWIKYKRSYSHYNLASAPYGDSINKNLIRVNRDKYQSYLAEQNNQTRYQLLIQHMIESYSPINNELCDAVYYGHNLLNTFKCSTYSWGHHLLETIRFDQARQVLLKQLKSLECDQWYAVSDWIGYLKQHCPYFLIPEKPTYKNKSNSKRYGDFEEEGHILSEHPASYRGRGEKDIEGEDGFERVEGRFVERFLACIPYTLGWVELAYDDKQLKSEIKPSLGALKAFKLTPAFKTLYQQIIPEPIIRVLPNFEMTIESPITPVPLLMELNEIGDIQRNDIVTQVSLNKNKVIHKSAQTHDFDIIDYLTKLNKMPLPQNVNVDLAQWGKQGEAFVLYDQPVLFETTEALPILASHTSVKISPKMYLVHHESDLVKALDQQNKVSLVIEHPKEQLQPIPKTYHSGLPKEGAKQSAKKAQRQKIALRKEVLISYHFPNSEVYQKIRDDLIENKVVIHIDDNNRLISLNKASEASFKQTLKKFSDLYQFTTKEDK